MMKPVKSDAPPPSLQDESELTLTVHAMPRAKVRTVGRLKMLLVLLACAAPVAASYFMYFVVRPDGRTNHAELLSPTLAWPADLPLTAQDGKPVAPATLRGQWLMVVMGSGACDEACEKRLHAQRQLREMLGRERDRIDKVFLVLDDAPIKPALQAALDAPPQVQVLRAPRALVAAWLKVPGDQVDAVQYLVDPMGEWMMRTPVVMEPAKFKRDLDRLLRASASWDRAGR